MNFLDVGSILLGLVVLVSGGELLVRGAAALAARMGMSPLVVGLTVVAFATSAPELAVTLGSVLGGEPALAVGNVVGSNIANVLLILGVSALILPLIVKVQLVRVDIPFMLALSVLFGLLALDGGFNRVDGAVLFVLLLLYVSVAIILSKRQSAPGALVSATSAGRVAQTAGKTAESMTEAIEEVRGPLWRDLVFLVAGVALLVVGAQFLVNGATAVARAFGVSELVIGLTVVAIGTSLPELATSIVAVRQGQRDLAVGNVVGSNIFNIGAVAGLAALIAPSGVPVPESALALDIPLMIAASLVLLPLAFTDSLIARWEGGLLFALYVGYLVYTVVEASGRPLERLQTFMLLFVTPLVILTVVVTTLGEMRRRRAGAVAPASIRGPQGAEPAQE